MPTSTANARSPIDSAGWTSSPAFGRWLQPLVDPGQDLLLDSLAGAVLVRLDGVHRRLHLGDQIGNGERQEQRQQAEEGR